MEDLINCGERSVQSNFRIAIRDICARHGVKVGESVEVFIKVKR